MGINTNLDDRLVSRKPAETTEIFQITDFGNVALPVITLEDKLYVIKDTISAGPSAYQLVFPQNAITSFVAVNRLGALLVSQVAVDAFFDTDTNSGILLNITESIIVIYVGPPAGSVLFNINFLPAFSAAELGRLTSIQIVDSAFRGFASLGSFTNSQFLAIQDNFFGGYDTGILFTDIGDGAVQSCEFVSNGTGTESSVTIMGDVITFLLTDSAFTIGTNQSVIRIDPAIPNDARVSINNVFIRDGGTPLLFDTSGVDGTFATVADNSSSSITITSVAIGTLINGATNARFSYTGADVSVGQTVEISGFTGDFAGYNGSHRVTFFSAGPNEFECLNVVFNGNTVGTLDIDQVVIGSNSHGLSNGDTLSIDCDGGIDYDGGAYIFGVTVNAFNISRVFTSSLSGSWSTRGLDNTNSRVLAFDNAGFSDSMYIAAIGYDNLTGGEVTITSAGVAVPILNAGSTNWVQFESTERFKLIPSTGEIIYVGNEPKTLQISYSAEMNSPITDIVKSGMVLQFAEAATPSTWVTDTDSKVTLTPKNKETIFQVTGFFIKAFNFGDRMRGAVVNDTNSDNIDVYASRITANA